MIAVVHAVGDEVLRALALRIAGAARSDASVGRMGGDEFVVVAPTTDVEEAQQLAERLADALGPAVAVEGTRWLLTASIGVTLGHRGDRGADVLRAADAAMYVRKQGGGDGVAVLGALRRSHPGKGRWAALGEAARYRLMLALAREVTGNLDLAAVLQATFVALRQILDCEGGSVQLLHEAATGEDRWLSLAAADPAVGPEDMAARLPVGSGLGGEVVSSGEPRYYPDVEVVLGVPGETVPGGGQGTRSWFGVPLVAGGATLGLLQLHDSSVNAWSESDRLAVLAFAPVVAAAVANACAFEREVARVLNQV